MPRKDNVAVQNETLRKTVAIQNTVLQSLYRRQVLAGLNGEVNTSPMNRDFDSQFGYPEIIDKQMYKRLFDRNGVAHRVVSLHPSECWLHPPLVYDRDVPSHSEFEKAWDVLCRKLLIISMLKRVDVLSGIGNYGVLLIGVSDSKALDQPVDNVEYEYDELRRGENKVLYLRPFSHAQVQILQTESDMTNPRYGQPVMYQIQSNIGDHDIEGGTDFGTVNVHWTRILHVADNRETSEVFGVPRMRLVYDNILDIKKIRGSSAEMFYKGAYPGFALEAVDDVTSGIQLDLDSMRKQMELYENGLQRWFGLTNAHANALSPQVQTPADHIRINLEEICIALGCPLRIFMGSEAAHLASDQDAAAWNNRLMERMGNYITPYIIEPFIVRMVLIGALPVPADGDFVVEWQDLNSMTESEKYQVAGQRLQNMSTYLSGGLNALISPTDMMQEFVGMSEDEAKGVLAEATKYNEEHAGQKDDTENN